MICASLPAHCLWLEVGCWSTSGSLWIPLQDGTCAIGQHRQDSCGEGCARSASSCSFCHAKWWFAKCRLPNLRWSSRLFCSKCLAVTKEFLRVLANLLSFDWLIWTWRWETSFFTSQTMTQNLVWLGSPSDSHYSKHLTSQPVIWRQRPCKGASFGSHASQHIIIIINCGLPLKLHDIDIDHRS